MAQYIVYYTEDLTAVYRGVRAFDETKFKRIALVEASDLEDLFRKMNVVDGTELPVQLKVRSMSCGDVAWDSETGQLWLCDLAGWTEVSATQG